MKNEDLVEELRSLRNEVELIVGDINDLLERVEHDIESKTNLSE